MPIVVHVLPRPNVVFALDRAKRMCDTFVSHGLCSKAEVVDSDERHGRSSWSKGTRTLKIEVEGLPEGRVPPHQIEEGVIYPLYEERPALTHIERCLRDCLGEILGFYRY